MINVKYVVDVYNMLVFCFYFIINLYYGVSICYMYDLGRCFIKIFFMIFFVNLKSCIFGLNKINIIELFNVKLLVLGI